MSGEVGGGDHPPPLQSFAYRGDENLPPMWRPAMFEQENALPGAELHFAVHDWHGLAGACEDHADM